MKTFFKLNTPLLPPFPLRRIPQPSTQTIKNPNTRVPNPLTRTTVPNTPTSDLTNNSTPGHVILGLLGRAPLTLKTSPLFSLHLKAQISHILKTDLKQLPPQPLLSSVRSVIRRVILQEFVGGTLMTLAMPLSIFLKITWLNQFIHLPLHPNRFLIPAPLTMSLVI